jgi:hypothetical protein
LNLGLCGTIPPALSALAISEIGFHFLFSHPGMQSYFMLHAILGCQVHAIMPIEMVSHKIFFLVWPVIMIFLISDTHIAWDDKHVPPCLVIGWDGISHFLHWSTSNCSLPNLYLPSIEDYQCEPLVLGLTFFFRNYYYLINDMVYLHFIFLHNVNSA